MSLLFKLGEQFEDTTVTYFKMEFILALCDTYVIRIPL